MIYFIQNSLTFRIKIGYTGKDDPAQRLAELQTGSDALLYLLATRDGTLQSEKDLHQQFAKYSADQGEWFNPGPDLIQYIIACATVKMGRDAVARAVNDLLKKSFPETKGEILRRKEQAAKEVADRNAESIRLAGTYVEELRKKGATFVVRPNYAGMGNRLTVETNQYSNAISPDVAEEIRQLILNMEDEVIIYLQQRDEQKS